MTSNYERNKEYQREYARTVRKDRAANRIQKGAHYLKKDKRWRGSCTIDGKTKSLGYYATQDDAGEAARLGRRTSKAISRVGKKPSPYSFIGDHGCIESVKLAGRLWV